MDQIILFDDPALRGGLLPFTFTRPVAEIRIGILTIREKWERHFKTRAGFFTQDYLKAKYGFDHVPSLFINGSLCPDESLLSAIRGLKLGQGLWYNNTLLAVPISQPETFSMETAKKSTAIQYEKDVSLVEKSWHIFQFNGRELRLDFDLITSGRVSDSVADPHTAVYNKDLVFVEEGAKIKAAVLNAENGPIYIGKNTEVQEGALIKGPFALGEGSIVNMGGKMRGDITVGPHSKIGGEVSNSVIFGYSNKGHDGFMGNSVIGEWCNFGAGSNISNLKNNYAPVKVWDYIKGAYVDSGLQFCGLMMGDHAKCGINTMFNTGTVVGVGANVFGAGYPRTFISSFSWGGSAGYSTYQLRKFEESAFRVMERRGIPFDDLEKSILHKVFDLTRPYRIWERENH